MSSWNPLNVLKDPWKLIQGPLQLLYTPHTSPPPPPSDPHWEPLLGHNVPEDTDNTFHLEGRAQCGSSCPTVQPGLQIKAFLEGKRQLGVAARNLRDKLRRSGK